MIFTSTVVNTNKDEDIQRRLQRKKLKVENSFTTLYFAVTLKLKTKQNITSYVSDFNCECYFSLLNSFTSEYAEIISQTLFFTSNRFVRKILTEFNSDKSLEISSMNAMISQHDPMNKHAMGDPQYAVKSAVMAWLNKAIEYPVGLRQSNGSLVL